MLDALFDNVKGQLVNNLTEKTGLGPAQAEQAAPLAKESVTEGITGALSSGNIGGILEMVKGATGGAAGGMMENAVYTSIASNFIGKLTTRLGIPESMAAKVSSFALPFILSKLGNRTQQAGDTDEVDEGSLLSTLGLDAGGIVGGLLGGKDKEGGGLGGMLGGMLK